MNHRFYPAKHMPFTNEPLRNQIKIVRTGDKGEGLVARIRFESGHVVFAFTGDVIAHQTLFTLQIERGRYIHDPYVMGKVLHSCEPNMRCDMRTFTFYALRDIEKNEYLTMDYETTEEMLYRQFHCCCGSPSCRGIIRGYFYRDSVPYAVGELNMGHSGIDMLTNGPAAMNRIGA